MYCEGSDGVKVSHRSKQFGILKLPTFKQKKKKSDRRGPYNMKKDSSRNIYMQTGLCKVFNIFNRVHLQRLQ